MKKIFITGGNTTTGELDLSDGGDTKAIKGEKIKWEIENDTIVKSIEFIPLKTKTKDIFVGKNGKHPKKVDKKKWKAEIADDVVVGDICEYSIIWKDGSGKDHTYDPKISINPSLDYLKWLSFILGFLGISYLVYSRMKNKKK